MKTLYVVRCWVPFPESEYGGLHVVIAESDEEACELLLGSGSARRHAKRCAASVGEAKRVSVSADEPSRVVRSFTT
jgi:hypothetical protein